MVFDPAQLALHRDYSVWHYDFQMGFAVEIDADKARRVLPPGLHPFEVKPGVAVLTINVLQFMEGNHNFERPFSEVTFSVNVIPDLFLAGRLPKFAVYVLNIGVSDPAFLEDPYNTDQLPFHPEPLEIAIDAARLRVEARDAHGPIFALENVAARQEFGRKEDFFQVFTARGDRLWHGAMTLDADSYEHQATGDAGVIHDHPIFRGLEAGMARADNYMQIFTGPEPLGIQHFYRLKPL